MKGNHDMNAQMIAHNFKLKPKISIKTTLEITWTEFHFHWQMYRLLIFQLPLIIMLKKGPKTH